MSAQQLASLLSREVDCLQALLSILNTEHNALLSGDVEAIEQITTKKNQALANQANTSLARQQFARQLTGSDSEQSLRDYITTASNRPELEACHASLLALAKQCQDENRINGRLITQKQQQAQGALNILRQTDNNPTTYSGHGDTSSQQSGRTLGKA